MKAEQVYLLPRVYVESSVIGAYFDERTDLVSVAQRHWSRIWWDEVQEEYGIVISEAVTDELSHPNFSYSHDALALVVARSLMPQNPVGDALHLALASYHKCDYLLTWNCKHNPILATPNQLIGEFND